MLFTFACIGAVSLASFSAQLTSAFIYACIGVCIGMFILSSSSKKAAKEYPELRIRVPENAENSPEWQQWAQQNGYKPNEQGLWIKGAGIFTSFTEIRFVGNELLAQECVKLPFGVNRFALNAPIMIGKPVRKSKIKALNQLLEQWQLPPITFN